MNKLFRLLLLAACISFVSGGAQVSAQRKKTASKPKARVESSKSKKTETSADVRRQQESTNREISRTREQIRLNEKEVSSKLSQLSALGEQIESGKKKVAASQQEVNKLAAELGSLQASIDSETRQLNRLRAEYLGAVKKMRAKRKQTSVLAFIFSSGSFNEAMRRMRYLRQFSKWRENKSAEIEGRVAELHKQTELLAQTKTRHDKALAENVAAQNALQKQYAAQDAIVVELKKNGQALREHLARKQSEANALKSRVSALIAEEQRKAEADRQAREQAEARRKAELARRKEQERLAAEKADAERRAAEQKRLRDEELLAQQTAKNKKESDSGKKKETKQPKKQDSKPAKNDSKKQEKVKTQDKPNKQTKQSEKKSETEVSYAEARGRQPRNSGNSPSIDSPKPVTQPAAGGDFASHKGSLPRPVSGPFRITSRFGNNPLPDMPNVTYDNPGIDAVVNKGATAAAVFAGTVSGVYVVPGYGTVIIVNHDGYFTVYGNIAQASVKVGDKVKQGHALGKVADDDDDAGRGLIHFEVWKKRDKQDPAAWIR